MQICFKVRSFARVCIFILFSVIIPNSFTWAHHSVQGGLPYPEGPDEVFTPGELCDRPDAKRYREGIDYCNRNVDKSVKYEVIDKYDHERGFHIREVGRENFKIDHYIPLCMGGSNNTKNLWPQHRKVYEITDPLEALACEKMNAGALLQRDAVEIIKQAKNNLDEVGQITERLQSL